MGNIINVNCFIELMYYSGCSSDVQEQTGWQPRIEW